MRAGMARAPASPPRYVEEAVIAEADLIAGSGTYGVGAQRGTDAAMVAVLAYWTRRLEECSSRTC